MEVPEAGEQEAPIRMDGTREGKMSDVLIVNGFCITLFAFLLLSVAYYMDLSELAEIQEELKNPLKNHLDDKA